MTNSFLIWAYMLHCCVAFRLLPTFHLSSSNVGRFAHNGANDINKAFAQDKTDKASLCRIKVIGVGGGGGNAVNRMMDYCKKNDSGVDLTSVELWAVNTDAQALASNKASNKLRIGNTISRFVNASVCNIGL